MPEEFRFLKERILRKRPVCELCGHRLATDLHHCIVHDSKRYHDLVTVEENLMPVCSVCHTSLEQNANGFDVRLKFARTQVAKGYNVSEWYRRLPLKIKEQWILDLQKGS